MYMALRKFKLAYSSPLLCDIYLHLMDDVESMDLETLSYLSVGLRNRFHTDNSTYRMVCRLGLVKTLPRLQHLLLTCQTVEELRQIVICFYNLAFLISDRMMEQLVAKVTEFMENGELRKLSSLPVLTKLLGLMVAKADWHEEHGIYVYNLFMQFKGNCEHLRPINALMLCKTIKGYGEPTSVLYEIYERLDNILKSRGYMGNVPMITVLNGMLKINPSAVPVKKVEEILDDIIESPHLADHVDDVFSIMRNVGIISNDLVDKFYDLSFEALKEDSDEVVRFANRYIRMHSVFTGLYINRGFEKKVIDLVEQEIEIKDVRIFHPRAFGIRIAILLYFGKPLNPTLYQKFNDFLIQFNAQTLLFISKAVDFRMKKLNFPLKRHERNEEIEMLENISLKVNKASENLLRKYDMDNSTERLVDISDLMRNYIYRNDYFNEYFDIVKDKLIERVNEGQVSVKTVMALCSAVSNPRQKIEAPELLECFVNFYLNRPDPTELHTDSAYKLLEVCFDSGYVPDKRFLDLFCEILKRDIDSLSGLRTLAIAFMLSGYQNVTKSLITAIFSDEFMERLDNELEMSSDRKHYPKVLRKQLMLLNRSVVLRYPEFGVPWFHSKYCAENEILLRQRLTQDNIAFKEQVSEQLAAVLGGWRYYKENSFSKYYNHIDFEIHFDSRGNALDMTSNVVEDDVNVTKCAVQVIPSNMLTVDTRSVAGFLMTNKTELELQGWKVIQISPYTWNSLQLGDSSMRKKYLNSAIRAAL